MYELHLCRYERIKVKWFHLRYSNTIVHHISPFIHIWVIGLSAGTQVQLISYQYVGLFCLLHIFVLSSAFPKKLLILSTAIYRLHSRKSDLQNVDTDIYTVCMCRSIFTVMEHASFTCGWSALDANSKSNYYTSDHKFSLSLLFMAFCTLSCLKKPRWAFHRKS